MNEADTAQDLTLDPPRLWLPHYQGRGRTKRYVEHVASRYCEDSALPEFEPYR